MDRAGVGSVGVHDRAREKLDKMAAREHKGLNVLAVAGPAFAEEMLSDGCLVDFLDMRIVSPGDPGQDRAETVLRAESRGADRRILRLHGLRGERLRPRYERRPIRIEKVLKAGDKIGKALLDTFRGLVERPRPRYRGLAGPAVAEPGQAPQIEGVNGPKPPNRH